jgi:hypothetical protein
MNHLVKHVIDSFNGANMFTSNVTNDILMIEGMTGFKTRHFYNNLCSLRFPDRKVEYLEVGTWKGSSFVAAMYNNSDHVNGTVVENWSEFGGPKVEFEQNLINYKINDVKIIEKDFFKWDLAGSPKFDIYLYDGGHSYEEQYDAITHVWPHLAKEAIIIIDDWNAEQVQKGTKDALAKLGANVLEKFEISYTKGGAHSPMQLAQIEFWNGIGVFIVSTDTSPPSSASS